MNLITKSYFKKEGKEEEEEGQEYILYADGGARGNPGIAAGGAVLWNHDQTKVIKEGSVFVGYNNTNNEAEYQGLLLGLEFTKNLSIKHLTIKMDSLLVVNQVNGKWAIRAPHLKPFHKKIVDYLKTLPNRYTLLHIPRKENSYADHLCNELMDEKQQEPRKEEEQKKPTSNNKIMKRE